MTRYTLSLAIVVTVFAGIQTALAGTYAVGTCRPQLHSYSTISAAVSAVPASSTVVVCPGIYPEQVSITQPLTLEGVSSGNSGRAVITVPISVTGLPQLAVNSSSVLFPSVNGEVAAQLLVQNINPPGPVTISNITVDGTGGNGGDCLNSDGFVVAGIFFFGASGLINHATTRHQSTGGCGVGIMAENESGTAESVNIINNSVHDADTAILTGSILASSPDLLTTPINGNFVANSYGAVNAALVVFNTAATVKANFVTNSLNSMSATGAGGIQNSMLFARNIVADSFTAISLSGLGVIAESNEISNAQFGLSFFSAEDNVDGATAQTNTIMNAQKAISGNCFVETITGNTINDASVGLDKASNASVSGNSFYNVDTIQTGCS